MTLNIPDDRAALVANSLRASARVWGEGTPEHAYLAALAAEVERQRPPAEAESEKKAKRG